MFFRLQLKCNIDDNREIALKYKIESIPAFILFQDGVEKDRLVGANKVKMEAMVSNLKLQKKTKTPERMGVMLH
jgi:thioredoxin-like negative regulator of GroEL